MSIIWIRVKHKNSFLELLQKYKQMFDGTLGNYIDLNYTIELKDDAKPFSIPKMYDPNIKKEVNTLIKIGILKKINNC